MSPLTPSLRLVVITLVVGCVVASLTGATAKERVVADNGLKIAVVNPARLILDTKFYKAETDKLETQRQNAQTRIRAWDQNRLLSRDEQGRLGDLSVEEGGKAGLDAAKKAEMTKLVSKGNDLRNELLNLQTKKDASQAELDRLTALIRLDQETQKREADEAQKVKDAIDKRLADIRQVTDSAARESLNKIAKKDGFNMVFSSEVLLYADNDITDKVIGDINSKDLK